MKKVFLPILSLVLLLTACYDKDIQEINNRLDNIENQKITSISEQIEAIQKTIPLLSEIDEQLSEHISSVEETSNKEIAALKEVNTTLKNQIAGLEKYVNDQLSNTTNWANATFATLAQYNSMVKEISGITLLMNNTKAELLAVISQVETSMKSWVNEQLTGYYDIAEINAKLDAIDKQIKAGDEENAKALNELKENLEKSKTELTEAYQKAITEAITNNNGVIDGKIASQIEAVNKRIDSEVDAMNTKIAALEERIKALEDKLDEILNRKLDIAFDVDNNIIVAPNYTLEIGYSVTSSTNSATVEVTSSADIKAKVVTNGLNGKISITTGDTIDEYSKVIVFVSNGENVIMRSITFEQATVQINNSDTKTIPVEGGTVELSFLTNVECEVVIASSASSWLTVVPETRALEEHTITLQATANEGTNRSAVVTVKSVEGNLAVQYTINQESNITILNYTTNDGKPLDPYTTEGFGAELAENSYDAATGEGFLKFNGKVTTIPEKAFIACSNLTQIELTKDIAAINAEAFSNCTALTAMDIPQGVKTIGDKAFYNCGGITEITIPSSVTSIGKSSFEGCGGKANINCQTYNDNSYSYGKFYKAKFTEVIIGDSVTSIGSYAFNGCTSLTSVTIGDSVTSIGERTFEYCSSLTSVTIPDSVTSIGEYAFLYCTSLTSVTIGNSVTEIGKYAFSNCTSLIAFYGKFASVDNRCLIVNGMLHSFARAGLTEYTISDSVTEIGEAAFEYCSSLTSVTIPDRVTSIGEYAFYGCTSLTSVTIGKRVTEIGNYAFRNCTSLTSVTIPDRVTSIGEYAFYGCKSLTSVTIPDSVTSIGIYAFYNCTSLKEVYYNGDLSAWCKINFNGYDANPMYNGAKLYLNGVELTEATIPSDVTEIKYYTFFGCTSLTSVTIPDRVTSIGAYAFGYCTSLKEVYCKPITPPTGGSNMFYNNASGRKIYVPRASVDAYKAAKYWSDYKYYIEPYDFE